MQYSAFLYKTIISLLMTLALLTPTSLTYAESNKTLHQIGDQGRYILPLIAVSLTAYHHDGQGFKEFAISMIATQLATEALKRLVREQRPNGHSFYSFPSGHASAVFSAAAFVHKRYGLKTSIPFYIGAALVGYSRVDAKAHYAHDVLAGAALGIGLTWLFTTPFQNKNVTIVPIADKNFVGVALNAKID